MKRKLVAYVSASGKIVRDRIPEIISDSGKKPIYSIVSIDEAVEGLEEKLSEELEEYLADHSLEEMADILEVMHGILFLKGIDWETLRKYVKRSVLNEADLRAVYYLRISRNKHSLRG